MLLALLDSDHVDHRRADDWLDEEIEHGWASCAITENGFVRIVSQPRYPSPIPLAAAIDLLRGACDGSTHEFWDCDVSLLDARVVDRTRLHGPRQVTDAYLLARPCHGARWALRHLDRTLSIATVKRARTEHLTVL